MTYRARFATADGQTTCAIYRVSSAGQIAGWPISQGAGKTRAEALTAAYEAVKDETLQTQIRNGVLDEESPTEPSV